MVIVFKPLTELFIRENKMGKQYDKDYFGTVEDCKEEFKVVGIMFLFFFQR